MSASYFAEQLRLDHLASPQNANTRPPSPSIASVIRLDALPLLRFLAGSSIVQTQSRIRAAESNFSVQVRPRLQALQTHRLTTAYVSLRVITSHGSA